MKNTNSGATQRARLLGVVAQSGCGSHVSVGVGVGVGVGVVAQAGCGSQVGA